MIIEIAVLLTGRSIVIGFIIKGEQLFVNKRSPGGQEPSLAVFDRRLSFPSASTDITI